MINIDDVFKEYSGHVFSFEYDPNNHIKLMKCYFKPEWIIEQDGIIVKKKDNITYLISKDPVISFTNMLDFVSQIVKINIEKEQKIKLFEEKKKELELIFNNSSLDELNSLDFKFKKDDIIPELQVTQSVELKKVD
jgi:hypothetical protein